jgi:hypothetical protein
LKNCLLPLRGRGEKAENEKTGNVNEKERGGEIKGNEK